MMIPVWVAVLAMFAGATVGLVCGALCAAAGRADAAAEAYTEGRLDEAMAQATVRRGDARRMADDIARAQRVARPERP